MSTKLFGSSTSIGDLQEYFPDVFNRFKRLRKKSVRVIFYQHYDQSLRLTMYSATAYSYRTGSRQQIFSGMRDSLEEAAQSILLKLIAGGYLNE